MNFNPLSLNPLALAGVAAVCAGLIAGSGAWFVRGTMAEAVEAHLKEEASAKVAVDTKAALDDFVKSSKAIKDAAASAQIDISGVSAQLAAIRKDQRNAKTIPLPVGCKPDAPRMRSLAATSAATDQAVAGSKPRGPVQTERPSE